MRVVLPAPGGATTTSRVWLAREELRSSRMASIGKGWEKVRIGYLMQEREILCKRCCKKLLCDELGARADVTHFDGTRAGTNTLDAYSVGAYWTHYGASGWYTDAVVQATCYEDDSQSSRGFRMKAGGYGLAASLEGGYAFQLGNGLVIEPQAQLVYQHVGFEDSADSGAWVYFRDTDSLAGRVGVRVKKAWLLAGEGKTPHVLTTWLRANLWHEFLGNNKTAFSSNDGRVPFSSNLGGSWAEVQAGVSTRLGETTSLFALGSYQLGFTGDRHAYSGKLGLRVDW